MLENEVLLEKSDRRFEGIEGLNEETKELLRGLSTSVYALWYVYASNVGNDTCRSCVNETLRSVSQGSNQLAKRVQTIRHLGFQIPMNKKMTCELHSTQTADRLLDVNVQKSESKLRSYYSPKEIRHMKEVCGNEDAFDFDRSPSARLELDHRVPHIRSAGNEPRIDPNDEDEVRRVFMCLSASHNLAKSRACESCVKTYQRPPFLGIRHWYQGDSSYIEELGCDGCGWAYPEEWRDSLNDELS